MILGENKYINQYNIIAVPIYVPLPWYTNIENTNMLMMKLELNEDQNTKTLWKYRRVIHISTLIPTKNSRYVVDADKELH